MYISLIIPTFNSETHLLNTINETKYYLEKMQKNFEIIIVDDSSKDNTWKIISDLIQTNSNLIGIRLKKNYGQTVATNIGISYANGIKIITMDDDLKYCLETINKMESESNKFSLIYGYIEKKNLKHIIRIFFDFLAGKKLATSFRFINRNILPNDLFIKEQLEVYFERNKIKSHFIISREYKKTPTRTNLISITKFIIFLLPNYKNNKLFKIILFINLLLIILLYNEIIFISLFLLVFNIFISIILIFKKEFNYFYKIDSPVDIIKEIIQNK